MSTHNIRLRGPWQYEWLSKTSIEPAVGRTALPAKWSELFEDQAGLVRFCRKFHRPTNLEPGNVVSLVFEGVSGEATFRLNGQELGTVSATESTEFPLRFPITKWLEPSNELQVDLEFDPKQTPTPGGLWGLVLLEIVE